MRAWEEVCVQACVCGNCVRTELGKCVRADYGFPMPTSTAQVCRHHGPCRTRHTRHARLDRLSPLQNPHAPTVESAPSASGPHHTQRATVPEFAQLYRRKKRASETLLDVPCALALSSELHEHDAVGYIIYTCRVLALEC